MSITVSESCNLNTNAQQQPITNQPQAHQAHNSYANNKQHNFTSPYQPTSSSTGPQMTNLSGQQMKKPGQQQTTQLKTINQKATNTNQQQQQTNNNQPGYRKVFIQRDYSEGTTVRFQNKFPEELEGYIERQHFDYLITTLNCYYNKAEAANLSTFCEGFCACLTAYLIYICMESHYEKYMRKTRDYINEQNDKVWKPRGLYVTDPIDRGLRILEITIGPRAQQRTMVGEQFQKRDNNLNG